MATAKERRELAKSSDIYEEDPCQPCTSEGKVVASERYCVDCEAFLCRTCTGHHKALKITKNHTLVSTAEVKKSPKTAVKDKCTTKCTVHKDKTVKYFCKTHSHLGCSVCNGIDHKQCSDVEYIPMVAGDIKNHHDFKKFDEKLKAIQTACKAGIADISKNVSLIDGDHGRLKKAMQQFRQQVIGALDKMENNLMAQADSIMREEKKKLDDLSKKLSKRQADVDAMLKQADTLLASGKNCDTYFLMKKEANTLVSLEEELKGMMRGQTLLRFEFPPNMVTLETIESGKLNCRKGKNDF